MEHVFKFQCQETLKPARMQQSFFAPPCHRKYDMRGRKGLQEMHWNGNCQEPSLTAEMAECHPGTIHTQSC